MHSLIVKGPYHRSWSFRDPMIGRFRFSSQTCSPTFISVSFFWSLLCCRCSRSFWTSCLVVSRVLSRSIVAGMLSSMSFMSTWGLMPIRSLWGDFLVVSLLQELWAYLAIGSSLAQLFCLSVVHGHRYCSTQAFICSICPLVQGWNAVERFCWTPRFLQRVFAKLDVNLGSWSEIICLGTPNHGIRCFRYSLATPGPLIVLWHRMNFAALEHPWLMIVSETGLSLETRDLLAFELRCSVVSRTMLFLFCPLWSLYYYPSQNQPNRRSPASCI